MTRFPRLFAPLQIGRLSLRNRIMMTTNHPRFTEERYLRYLEDRAQAGVALLAVPAGLQFPTGPGLFSPDSIDQFDSVLPHPLTRDGLAYYDATMIPRLQRLVEVVHRHGAACVGQLYHPGASKNRASDNLQPGVGPSRFLDEHLPEVPHVLDEEEIAGIVEAYGHAARRVNEAGLDAIEIHAGHGYLIEQFLSPFSNDRSDRYGGDLDGRMRLLLEVIDEIRRNVGPDFPVGIRLAGDEFIDEGLAIDNVVEIGRRIAGQLDYINITGGTHSGYLGGPGPAYVSPWLAPLGLNVPAAAAIKKAVDIPVIVGGRINAPEQAEGILADGAADMVGMVRALFADLEFVSKAKDGRAGEIRKCIGNNECHGLYDRGLPIRCAVNASMGREDEMEITPARLTKRVLVIGGGPAGMEAARVAALRGHTVDLYERSSSLGGMLNVITRDPGRRNMKDFVDYLEGQLDKLGVNVHTDTEADSRLVAEQAPDAVVVAAGAERYFPSVPGARGNNVVTDVDVLEGRVTVGDRVVVVAGLEEHLPPLSIADFLAAQGKTVEVISEMMVVGYGVEKRTLGLFTKRLLELGVVLTPLTKLESINGRTVTVSNSFTHRRREIPDVDTVVLTGGGQPRDHLKTELKDRVKELYLIGDCLAPRRLMHAVLDGSRVGHLI
jgi:2,4-dienoyl-CoA reductase-like NADH-dependent reductase (Old Yellow Enzyme family)/thioredoxin reductase